MAMPKSSRRDVIGTTIDTVLDRGYRGVARPLLFRSGKGEAEAAHQHTLNLVRRIGTSPLLGRVAGIGAPAASSPISLLGLTFPNRFGVAAGMDKNGIALRGWQRLGFGHVELGTVTPREQPGNPAPRLFRLVSSRAAINRMGFNNKGVDHLAAALERDRDALRMPIGVSIGKWKQTPIEDATQDYLACAERLHGLADYLAVNVSSPNTPNLRSLQDAEPLRELLSTLVAATQGRAEGGTAATPVLLKLAPDLTESAIDEAVGVAVEAGVAGLIATNTTLSRAGIDPRDAALAEEAGGLSGAPLTLRAREVVGQIRARTDLPLIGVGGVMTGADARAMVDAGADLIQLYTGLVYRGPALAREVAAAIG